MRASYFSFNALLVNVNGVNINIQKFDDFLAFLFLCSLRNILSMKLANALLDVDFGLELFEVQFDANESDHVKQQKVVHETVRAPILPHRNHLHRK